MKYLLCVFLLFFPVSAMAQSQSTDIRPIAKRIIGEALLNDFKGTTHDGAYNFTDDGEPRRFYRETHHDDAQTTYEEDGAVTKGVWTVRQDNLCFLYEDMDMNGGCFRVYKVGNCYYYYSTNIPESAYELDRDYWTARSVKEGEEPNCDAGVS